MGRQFKALRASCSQKQLHLFMLHSAAQPSEAGHSLELLVAPALLQVVHCSL